MASGLPQAPAAAPAETMPQFLLNSCVHPSFHSRAACGNLPVVYNSIFQSACGVWGALWVHQKCTQGVLVTAAVPAATARRREAASDELTPGSTCPQRLSSAVLLLCNPASKGA